MTHNHSAFHCALRNSLFCLLLIAGLSNCQKLLDVTPQDTVLTNVALTDIRNLDALLVSVYNQMESGTYYGRNFILAPDLLADNGFDAGGYFSDYYNNNDHISIYTVGYQNINRLNLLLATIDGTTTADTIRKKQLKGQALFLRGLHYFDLIRVYARPPGRYVQVDSKDFDLGVPVVLTPTTDAAAIEQPARATVPAVYAQILKDLNDAASLLNNNLAPNRASKVAALALLSRVYLYNRDWANTEKFATEAISMARSRNIALTTAENYLNNWGNNYPEAIFQLTVAPGQSLFFNSLQSAYYNHPTLGGYGSVRASLLFRTTEGSLDFANDIRARLLTASYYPLKFPGAKGFGNDDIAVIRVSELYLNRAEARARLGNVTGALEDLNLIYERALRKKITGQTGDVLLRTILRERNAELAFEGHRLFDLLRTDANVRTSIVKPYNEVYSLSSFWFVASIPALERQTNPNLKQNPGYTN